MHSAETAEESAVWQPDQEIVHLRRISFDMPRSCPVGKLHGRSQPRRKALGAHQPRDGQEEAQKPVTSFGGLSFRFHVLYVLLISP